MFFFQSVLQGLTQLKGDILKRSVVTCKGLYQPSTKVSDSSIDVPLESSLLYLERLVTRLSQQIPSITDDDKKMINDEIEKLYNEAPNGAHFAILAYDQTAARNVLVVYTVQDSVGTDQPARKISQYISPFVEDLKTDSFISITTYSVSNDKISNVRFAINKDIDLDDSQMMTLSYVFYPFLSGLKQTTIFKPIVSYIQDHIDELVADRPEIKKDDVVNAAAYFQQNGVIDMTTLTSEFRKACMPTPTPSPAPTASTGSEDETDPYKEFADLFKDLFSQKNSFKPKHHHHHHK